MKTSTYLDLAKKATKSSSDNEFARMMGWGKSQVNNYRHDRQPMDNKQALQIAEIIHIPVWNIIADMEMIRADKKGDKDMKKAWAKLARATKQAAFATPNLLIAMSIFSLGVVECILCKIGNFDSKGLLPA